MRINSCCFCFPLRSGVFSITGLSLIAYGCCFIWFLFRQDVISAFFQDFSPAAPIFYICIAVSSIAALCSAFGLLSVSWSNARMMRIFLVLYIIVATIVLAIMFAAWGTLMANRSAIISSCNEFVRNNPPAFSGYGRNYSCDNVYRKLGIAGGLIVFIGNALQIYFIFVVYQYTKRLAKGTEPQSYFVNLQLFYPNPPPPPPPQQYHQSVPTDVKTGPPPTYY